jgi:hypothetical protein
MTTTYYIMGLHDTEQDCINSDINLLGEHSFNTFHTGLGFKILLRLIDLASPLISTLTIKDSFNKTLTITEFLDSLQGLIIK